MPTWVSELYKRLAAVEHQPQRVPNDNKLLIEELSTLKPQASSREQSPHLSQLININTGTSAFIHATLPFTQADTTTAFSQKTSYAQVVSSHIHIKKAPRRAVARTFIPVTSQPGIQYIYIHSRSKERISSVRSKLNKLGLQSSRILNIQYPDSQVIGILAHNDYLPTIMKLSRHITSMV
ncbi:hypothetical protein BDB01DRAFT_729848 [Pilobolus umbonatus]|nr:hypothetical protein BDB01DRAFT_729848 [Pilobolus umbonatus]